MQDFRDNTKKDFEAMLARLAGDVALLHSTRATPALVEDIIVSAYGQKLPLKQLASLSAPDARTIVVQPWDTHSLPDIQKAIETSHLGMGMTAEEKFIRLTLPQLSEERRREILKTLGKKVEETKIGVRRIRDHVQKSLEESFRKKEISEDEKFRSKEALQKLTDEYTKRATEIEEKKSREIIGT